MKRISEGTRTREQVVQDAIRVMRDIYQRVTANITKMDEVIIWCEIYVADRVYIGNASILQCTRSISCNCTITRVQFMWEMSQFNGIEAETQWRGISSVTYYMVNCCD